MEKFRKNNKLLRSVLCFALAMALALTHFAFPVSLRAGAESDEDAYTGLYETTAVSISNGQFDSVSGSFPKTASSWTGSTFETDSGEIISGVIDLSAASYASNSETYKLTQYDEYKNGVVPLTPFGQPFKPNGTFPHYEGTTTNVLMLNTNGLTTTYKYSSSSIALEANGFYKISAWAKTTDFRGFQNSGAAIKLSGIENEDIGFNNINTVKNLATSNDIPVLTLDNNYGWQQYSIYVSTDFRAQSVSLNLQIGDMGEDYYYPTNGYVFFANVTAYQIAPEVFDMETSVASSNIFVADLNKGEFLTNNDDDGSPILSNGNATEIGSFSNNASGRDFPLGWSTISEDGTGGAMIATYNPRQFTLDNIYNIESNPSAPRGIERTGGNSILVISSHDGRNYREVAAGIKSKNILIERNQYYRLAAWVKSQDTTSAGATIVISGQKTSYDTELDIKKTNIVGEDAKSNRYGWTQQSFFIKGSAVMDCIINIELWLGQLDQLSKGIAMFDDVTLETITEKEYTDNVSGGVDVQLDGDTIGRDTGITNGLFYNAGSFEEYEYPLAPSSWTMFDAATVGTVGFSTQEVLTDNIKSGIMPVDTAHFEKNRENYLGALNPLPNEALPRNVLFMASTDKTAFCYRSSEISISSASIAKVYAELMTTSIDGYGASLVLKNGDKVLSTIENIDTNGRFETFSFYVQGNASDSTQLTLEIWLGLGDKNLNRSKLSSGYLFVKEAGLATETTESDFETYVSAYRAATNANVATLDVDYFANFDRYSTDFIKEAYNWTLDTTQNENANDAYTKHGIFDYSKLKSSGQSNVPQDFRLDESGNTNILFMQNTSPNAATIIYDTNYTLNEGKYYEVSVSMKVDIPEEYLASNPNAVGARIALRGTEFAFEDIKDSRKYAPVFDEATGNSVEMLVDNDFYTYTFFVKVSDTTPTSVSFEISLGGNKNILEFCTGRVYVADISIEEIESDAYTVAIENLDDEDPYIINADLTVLSDEPTDESTVETDEQSWWSRNWYIIPSVIFGAALVLALLAIFVRKFMERRPRRAKKKSADYDRKNLKKDESVEVTEADEITYDEFDDDNVSARPQSQAKPRREAKPVEETESSDKKSEDSENVETPVETVIDNLEEFEE